MKVPAHFLFIVTLCMTSLPFHNVFTTASVAQESDNGSVLFSDSNEMPISTQSFHGGATLGVETRNSTTIQPSTSEESWEVVQHSQQSASETKTLPKRADGDLPEALNHDATMQDLDVPAFESDYSSNDSIKTSESFSGNEAGDFLSKSPSDLFESDSGWFGREGIGTSIKAILVMSVIAIAPAFLLTITSYVRVSVVLFLLRQALGAGQIPSNQIIATLAVFLTVLIMSPVGVDVYQKAVIPYSENQISRVEAFQRGQEPIRTFLWKQIERTGNADMISLFTKYLPDVDEPEFIEDVSWRALAPAFLLSELKTAFLIGFQIFLPFLVIDFIVSCVLVSTGMMMLPPAIVSLPLKLTLFVLVDGWTLVAKSLIESFA